MNEVAGPAATDITSPATPESPWTPGVIACVACIALAGGSLTYALGAGVRFPNLVPVLLLASGCMAAVRWMRAGVRNELRGRAAGKLAAFGGGVYGAMAMATLLWLEGTDLAADLAGAGSPGAFVRSLDLGWLISQAMESVGFAIRAGLWPWTWFGGYGVPVACAAVALDALLAFVLPRYRASRNPPAAAAAS